MVRRLLAEFAPLLRVQFAPDPRGRLTGRMSEVKFAFPVTLDVAGRRCVVLGDGPLAGEKVEALREAGATVEQRDTFTAGDLDGVFLVIVSGEGDVDAAAVWREADERGVLCNSLDDVSHCHFAFPSIVRRGDLRIAISTGGRAPALSRRLRLQLEDDLPVALAGLVDALGEARERALPRQVPFAEWAARWRSVVDDLDELVEVIEQGDRDEVVDRVLTTVTERAS